MCVCVEEMAEGSHHVSELPKVLDCAFKAG